MGGMGYSFGAGIGMAFGRAVGSRLSRRTVVVAGDGAFFMHGMEVHTAVQYRLPVTFVLFNNNAHAMCVTREQLFYDDLYSYNRFGPSRLGAGLAAMFPGPVGDRRRRLDALAAALEEALDADGPSVISVECSADEIPPFAPFFNQQATKSLADRHLTKGEDQMSLPALDDITFTPAPPCRSRGWSASRPRRWRRQPRSSWPRCGLCTRTTRSSAILHGQRLRRLPTRRAVRIPGRYAQPRGVDVQAARLHPHRRARAVAGLRPAAAGYQDLHPHGGQRRRRAPSTTTAPGTRASTSG